MHLHELNKIHAFAPIQLLEVDVEYFSECFEDDIHLLLVKNLQGLLVLKFKALLLFQ